jgi:hypothetical protein
MFHLKQNHKPLQVKFSGTNKKRIMKKIINISLAIFALIMVTSCVKDDDENTSTGARVVGFSRNFNSFIFTGADTDPYVINEKINFIGGNDGTPSNEDIVIYFSIDPSSTAIEGTDYTISGNTTTLVAGSNFTQIPITVDPSVLPGNTPKTIVINLDSTNSDKSVIANNKKQITITIAKCESNLAGTYDLVVTRTDNNSTYYFPSEVITQIGIGQYVTSSTGPYGNGDLTGSGAPRDGFIFNDVCQSIQIEEQYLGDYYSNLVEGDSNSGEVTLDPVTGEVVSITMYYSIRGFSSGTYQRTFTAVYTKI